MAVTVKGAVVVAVAVAVAVTVAASHGDTRRLRDRRTPWKTIEAVELATLEWVSWFNHHRLLEPIGYIPPAEAEAHYCRQRAETPKAA